MVIEDSTGIEDDQRSQLTIDVELIEFNFNIFQRVPIIETQ